jgi:p-aminobenzoyl-glutamate transporter AbgT
VKKKKKKKGAPHKKEFLAKVRAIGAKSRDPHNIYVFLMQFFFCARSSHDAYNAALTHHTLSNVIALLENQLVKSHSQELALNATVRVTFHDLTNNLPL